MTWLAASGIFDRLFLNSLFCRAARPGPTAWQKGSKAVGDTARIGQAGYIAQRLATRLARQAGR
jgi:hypothetical protein